MSKWTPPTVTLAEGADPVVRCVCGRLTTADMMVDVRALAPELRCGHGRGAAADAVADHLCDACRSRLVRTGRISREEMAMALGAPTAAIAKARRLDTGRDRGGAPPSDGAEPLAA